VCPRGWAAMTAAADRLSPGRSREELRLVELASGLLRQLDAYRLTGRLPLEIQVQASRLRHAVKLVIQAEAARTATRPPAPPPAASRDQAAALRAWIASQPWVQPGPVGWVYLTLFWSSTGRVVLPAGWGYRQQDVVDLAGDEPLEAADDLPFGLALGGAPGHVGAGARIPAQPAHGDHPQRAVGVAVAASVQPVAGGLARGRRDGGHPAQVREGGLAGQPVGVIAGGDQQRCGGVDAHPGQRQQRRSSLGNRRPRWWSSARISA